MKKKTFPERSFFETVAYQSEKAVYHVSSAELSPFLDQNKELALMIGDAKGELAEREGLSAARASEWIEEHCQISEDTLKKTILGKIKPTRTFLYKFTVGMKMSPGEANEFFELCGGPLYERCMADYICLKALEDKDDIETFICDFEKHTEMALHMRRR